MIRQKIKLDGTTMNLNFTLSSNDDFYGQQQEIDNLVQAVSNSLINPENDVEERRFKYNPNNSTAILNFQFYDQINNTYSSSFTAAGFTSDEITNNRNNILNSFFILDFYDSFDVNSQNKIFTTYLTKIVNNFTGEITPSYLIDSDNSNQYYYWNIPISYINSQTHSTIFGYVKFSFYNAKDGTITTFYNPDYENTSIPRKMFFNATLDLVNRTWSIKTNEYPVIRPKESFNSVIYNNKINDANANYNNTKQNFPIGNTFDSCTGKYIITNPSTSSISTTTSCGSTSCCSCCCCC